MEAITLRGWSTSFSYCTVMHLGPGLLSELVLVRDQPMRGLYMIGSIALTEAPESPVSPDISADAHHLLDLHVPLSETGLGVIVLVAGDSDVSATEKEIAHLKLMHSPVVRCRCLFLPFNN